MADLVAVEILGEVVGADLLAHQDHARVRRAAHNLAQRHGHRVVAVVDVGDLVVAGEHHGRHVERRVHVGHAQIDRHAAHERLEDAAGLVGVGHHAQVHVLGARGRQVGLVVGGVRAGGEDLSARGIGHDDGPVVGAAVGHRLGKRLLRLALDVDVEREHQVVAIDRRLLLVGASGDIAAVGAALAHDPAVFALQVLLVLQLQARDALVVGVDDAEHLRGELAVRVDALDRLLELDAREALLHEGVGHVLVDLARHVGPGGLLVDLVVREALLDAQVLHERVCNLLLVLDVVRVERDVAALLARREHVAVAVVERAALGVKRRVGDAARLEALHVDVVVEDLVLRELEDARARCQAQQALHERAAGHERAIRCGASRTGAAASAPAASPAGCARRGAVAALAGTVVKTTVAKATVSKAVAPVAVATVSVSVLCHRCAPLAAPTAGLRTAGPRWQTMRPNRKGRARRCSRHRPCPAYRTRGRGCAWGNRTPTA